MSISWPLFLIDCWVADNIFTTFTPIIPFDNGSILFSIEFTKSSAIIKSGSFEEKSGSIDWGSSEGSLSVVLNESEILSKFLL